MIEVNLGCVDFGHIEKILATYYGDAKPEAVQAIAQQIVSVVKTIELRHDQEMQRMKLERDVATQKHQVAVLTLESEKLMAENQAKILRNQLMLQESERESTP